MLNANGWFTLDSRNKLSTLTRFGSETWIIIGLPIVFMPSLNIFISCGPIIKNV